MQEVIEMKVCGFQGTEKSVAKNATKTGEGISLHGWRGRQVQREWGGIEVGGSNEGRGRVTGRVVGQTLELVWWGRRTSHRKEISVLGRVTWSHRNRLSVVGK